MRAMILTAYGGPEVLRLDELPEPAAGPGQVLVRIHASSVNPVDVKSRALGPATAPAPGGVLGTDMAGVVEAVGAGVEGFAPGDAVYGCVGGVRGLQGTLADYVAADARLLAPLPQGLSFREAAALPLVTITAWEGLFDRAGLKPGESVLVHGGVGGVGHVAVQLAAQVGARVTATVSSPEKAAIARRLGAAEVVDYREEGPEAYVARLTGGHGFDLVFDSIGGANIAPSLAAAAVSGRVVTIVARGSVELTAMHAKGLTLHAVFMLLPMLHDRGRARHGAILREAAALVAAGALRPLLDAPRFTLEQAAEAHRRLESGAAIGKVVVELVPD